MDRNPIDVVVLIHVFFFVRKQTCRASVVIANSLLSNGMKEMEEMNETRKKEADEKKLKLKKNCYDIHAYLNISEKQHTFIYSKKHFTHSHTNTTRIHNG